MAMRRPRRLRISFSRRPRRLWPRKITSPEIRAVFGRRPRIDIEVTLLPEPDSPTIPSTSFSWTSNDTPSTAFTTPSSVGNSTWRSRTESTAPSGISASSTGSRSVSVRRLRVKRMAQAVAEEVDGKDGEQDEQAGEVDEIRGVGAHGAIRLGKHRPPRQVRRLDAEAEERERRLGDDRQAHDERRVHRDRPDSVGEEVPHDDPEARRTRGTRRL